MEGKTVILSVLIMSLVMAQIQVEAKSCCPSTTARNTYNICRIGGKVSQERCAKLAGCKLIKGKKCPKDWEKGILENTGDVVNEYCNLGCASSVCDALITLQNSDASENVNVAVEECSKACSIVCAKDSIVAPETA